MHLEIFNGRQNEMLPFIQPYTKNYYMVGGTAIALHLGHRSSIDFDLFTIHPINKTKIKKAVSQSPFKSYIIVEKADQIHFVVNDVKLTFFQFPFDINATIFHKQYFRIPELLTLSAMKAFALGGRGKWKDYLDLYFIIKGFYSITEICNEAIRLFPGVFSPSLFIKQLSYFEDISFEEQVEFMPGFEVEIEEVKSFLVEAALEGF